MSYYEVELYTFPIGVCGSLVPRPKGQGLRCHWYMVVSFSKTYLHPIVLVYNQEIGACSDITENLLTGMLKHKALKQTNCPFIHVNDLE